MRIRLTAVADLIKQYQTDEAMQKEVADILADGRITMNEFMGFAKKHGVNISLADLPKYIEQAKQLGFMK